MQMVGRADMNYLHPRIAGEFIERTVSAINFQRPRTLSTSLWRTAENASDRNSQTSERFQVGAANKTRTDDRRA
jgi:hypothetical protein